MPSESDAFEAWADAHRTYADAVDVVLGKHRPEAHDLDVVESLALEATRRLAAYRVGRGERETGH